MFVMFKTGKQSISRIYDVILGIKKKKAEFS